MSFRRFASWPQFDGKKVVLDDDVRLLHTVQATVDFGHAGGGETDSASVTVPATWVTETSMIMCQPVVAATLDHDPIDVVIERISAFPSNLIPGISFDIVAYAPHETWGRYLINAVG